MKRIVILMICILFAAGIVFAQSDLQSVAIVRLTRSEPITVKQLRTLVEQAEKSSGRAATVAERRQLLDSMINEKLIMQAAERDKITVSDAEINNYLQQLRGVLSQSLGRQPTDPEFEIAIRNQFGVDLQTFNVEIRRQMLLQKYIVQKKGSLFESLATPTEQDINDTYNLTRTQFIRPDTVRFSMILVPFGNNAADKAKAKTLADRLVREIASDASKFDETVLRSQTPNSGYRGGDGGYLPRNLEAERIVGRDFINTAFSLKQGEVSKLIEGTNGYQIIKITETYSQKNLELADLYQLGARGTVREYIQSVLVQERQQAAEQRAIQEVTAELRQGNPFQVFENLLSW